MKQIQAMGHTLTIIFNTDKAPAKKRGKRGMDCLLQDSTGRTVAEGRSECSYKEEKFNREVGENIALHRALERLAKVEIAKAKNQFRKGTGANRLIKAKKVEAVVVAEVVAPAPAPAPVAVVAPVKKVEKPFVTVIETAPKSKKSAVKSAPVKTVTTKKAPAKKAK